MKFTLDGERFELTADLVRSRISNHVPEPIREYWVEIDGVRRPVKQVVTTPAPHATSGVRLQAVGEGPQHGPDVVLVGCVKSRLRIIAQMAVLGWLWHLTESMAKRGRGREVLRFGTVGGQISERTAPVSP